MRRDEVRSAGLGGEEGHVEVVFRGGLQVGLLLVLSYATHIALVDTPHLAF